MAGGPNHQAPPAAVANDEPNEVQNNGPLANGGVPPVLELDGLADNRVQRPTENGGNEHGSRPPAYRGLVQQRTVSIKVKNHESMHQDEMDAMSQHFRRKIKLLTEKGLGERGVSVVKTAIFPGCIFFHTGIYLPRVDHFEQDLFEIIDCLPSHLQHEKIEVMTKSYHATVQNKQLVAYCDMKQAQKFVDNNRDLSSDQPPRVAFLEPPCLTQGLAGQRIVIHSRDQRHLRSVTELDGRVINDAVMDQSSQEVIVPYGREQCSVVCGSVRLLTCDDDVPNVSPWALFGWLPADAAAELNDYYAQRTQSLNQRFENMMDIREHVWSCAIQPLLTDLNFVLSYGQPEQMPSSNEAFTLVLDHLLDFFVGENLHSCASLVRKHCGKPGTNAVLSRCIPMFTCMDYLTVCVFSSWVRHLCQKHGYDRRNTATAPTENRFAPSGMHLGSVPVCW